ncbi:MAG: sugar transferase [Deltaproteobacteria bacterium]|nr:sugar transferase [Deltaproteobacteria bacterium]
MKRVLDIVFSFIGLLVASPVLLISMVLIWSQDFHSPFYVAPRVGRNGKVFRMVKLRSMVAGADKAGVDSTAATDTRITWVGRLIRRYKLDELSQLWNVLRGEMSLVGPRPNVEREVALYTEAERHLLDVRPGITDLSSIVFSDEGDILAGSEDPDLMYNQLIRPWKSRLGLLYVERRGVMLDFWIIGLTALAIVSRPVALKGVGKILDRMGADGEVRRVATREEPLQPYPPPGAEAVVTSRG